jgi:hypothetical protein
VSNHRRSQRARRVPSIPQDPLEVPRYCLFPAAPRTGAFDSPARSNCLPAACNPFPSAVAIFAPVALAAFAAFAAALSASLAAFAAVAREEDPESTAGAAFAGNSLGGDGYVVVGGGGGGGGGGGLGSSAARANGGAG